MDSADDTTYSASVVIAYDILQIAAILILSAVVITVKLSARVRRIESWLPVISSFLILALSNILLIGQQGNPKPYQPICLLQAASITTVPMYCSAMTVIFTIQVYVQIQSVMKPEVNVKVNLEKLQTISIILTLVFFAVFLGCNLCPIYSLGRIIYLYRILHDGNPHYRRSVLSVLFFTLYGLSYQPQGLLAAVARASITVVQKSIQSFSFYSAVARVIAFTLLVAMSLAMAMVNFFTDKTSLYADLIIRAMPLCVALLFGIHRDIIAVWFCRKPNLENDNTTNTSITSGIV
ncbi:hypothetical protein AMATHDRAFT_87411 [Amanita thiersii Skay4041]|uniref:G-protein coupled receptors family 1 profile domain-containing protein n=1 Tax=Amanita thiersii Skay4041 TaxID=703135 RepID=A0A2A9ND05_9AGAR|nr:hypothetical protein AMATHDRAFT_87411 [Amanita thiersii Skay4041]